MLKKLTLKSKRGNEKTLLTRNDFDLLKLYFMSSTSGKNHFFVPMDCTPGNVTCHCLFSRLDFCLFAINDTRGRAKHSCLGFEPELNRAGITSASYPTIWAAQIFT